MGAEMMNIKHTLGQVVELFQFKHRKYSIYDALDYFQRHHITLLMYSSELDQYMHVMVTGINDHSHSVTFRTLDDMEVPSDSVFPHKITLLCTTTDGTHISFTGELKSISSINAVYFSVDFPLYDEIVEQRQNPRTCVGINKDLQIKFHITEQYCIDGYIWDISLGGLHAIFERKIAEAFNVGDIIEYCDIELNNCVQIHAKLQIRWLKYDAAEECTHIGGQFVSLNQAQEHLLMYFIAGMRGSYS